MTLIARYNNDDLKKMHKNNIIKLDDIYYRCYNNDPEYLEWNFSKQISQEFDPTHISADIRNKSEYLVYYKDYEIAGFVVFHIDNEDIYILLLCVDSTFRNQKIGYNMLDYIVNLNNNKIILEVWNWNQDAIRFYEKFGFKHVRSYFDGSLVDVFEYIKL